MVIRLGVAILSRKTFERHKVFPNIFFSILPDYHDYPDYERKREITITVSAATQVRGTIGVPPECAQSNSGAVARVLFDLADREVGKLLISFFTQRNQVRRRHLITMIMNAKRSHHS